MGMLQSAARAALVVLAAAGPVRDPAELVWQKRVLLVFAPGAADPALRKQQDSLGAAEAGVSDRDLAVMTSFGGSQDDGALRRRYGVGEARFAVLLIGKDGGVKLRSDQPIPANRLFATIDAMPMRRQEAGGRRPG